MFAVCRIWHMSGLDVLSWTAQDEIVLSLLCSRPSPSGFLPVYNSMRS